MEGTRRNARPEGESVRSETCDLNVFNVHAVRALDVSDRGYLLPKLSRFRARDCGDCGKRPAAPLSSCVAGESVGEEWAAGDGDSDGWGTMRSPRDAPV